MTDPAPPKVYALISGKPTGKIVFVSRGPAGRRVLVKPCSHVVELEPQHRVEVGDAIRCPRCHEIAGEAW